MMFSYHKACGYCKQQKGQNDMYGFPKHFVFFNFDYKETSKTAKYTNTIFEKSYIVFR